ncbi:hypothetical protein [Casimicrobium huifangae]|uniref:hypothetical protein n=1 Tax=Casimicrobium huifangae TaxID=2591109 RepID=UPI0012EB994C|nr:hypothetical protein [Casimicrobium huifangae]
MIDVFLWVKGKVYFLAAFAFFLYAGKQFVDTEYWPNFLLFSLAANTYWRFVGAVYMFNRDRQERDEVNFLINMLTGGMFVISAMLAFYRSIE